MGIKKRKYSQEFKEEIVQRALNGERILALGKENNISPGLINRWKRQYLDGELSGNNNQEIKKLETQVGKLEQMIGKLTMENYILKRERIHTTEEKRGFIHHYRSLFKSIKEGCRLMGIKRSTLYYQSKGNLDKKIKETDIKNKIKDISYKHPYYGYRRITAQLRRDKVIVNHKSVLRMMRKMGIQGRIKRKYITTTNSKHHNKIYSNLIKDKELTGINQVWCADITYIRILNGFVYLAAILDIYSRKIVGYAIGKPYLLNLLLLHFPWL